jgi:hypothetical protein
LAPLGQVDEQSHLPLATWRNRQRFWFDTRAKAGRGKASDVDWGSAPVLDRENPGESLLFPRLAENKSIGRDKEAGVFRLPNCWLVGGERSAGQSTLTPAQSGKAAQNDQDDQP